jgi:hypothetical protein
MWGGVEEMRRRLWPRRGRGVDLVLGPKGEGGLDFRGSDEACMGSETHHGIEDRFVVNVGMVVDILIYTSPDLIAQGNQLSELHVEDISLPYRPYPLISPLRWQPCLPLHYRRRPCRQALFGVSLVNPSNYFSYAT